MKVALDANRYSDLCRGIAAVVEPTSHADHDLILLTRDVHFKHVPQLSQL
jgi:hypothetical protein